MLEPITRLIGQIWHIRDWCKRNCLISCKIQRWNAMDFVVEPVRRRCLTMGPCGEFLSRMYNYIFCMIFWQPQYNVFTLELSILFLNRPRTSNRHFPWRWRWAGNPGSNPGSSENFYKSSYSATFVPRSDNVGLSLSQSSWTVCIYRTWHDLIYSTNIPLFYEYTK